MSEDKIEWDETLELLKKNNDSVSSDLSFGTYITLSEELFQNMIQEINDNRIRNGNLAEGIDVIVVSDDEKDSDGSDAS